MRVGILTILLSFTLPTVSLSASAQADFSAILVEVLDGDTIKDVASGAVIRLNGIDACEANQFATTQSGQRFNCGILPAARLIEWTSDQRLNCVVSGQDKYGRYLATCATTSIRDIGAQLIQEGLAVAYYYRNRPTVPAYAALENEARVGDRGLWRTEFEDPRQNRLNKPHR